MLSTPNASYNLVTENITPEQLLAKMNEGAASANDASICMWKMGENGLPVHDYSLHCTVTNGAYTVNFDPNGGEFGTTSNIAISIGDAFPTPAPTKSGYDFVAWTLDDLGNNSYYGFSYHESNPFHHATTCFYLGLTNVTHTLHAMWKTASS